jgi:hypothetical protein
MVAQRVRGEKFSDWRINYLFAPHRATLLKSAITGQNEPAPDRRRFLTGRLNINGAKTVQKASQPSITGTTLSKEGEEAVVMMANDQ